MNRKVRVILDMAMVALCMVIIGESVHAERIDLGERFSLGGSVRARYERKENIAFTKTRDDYFLHQIRLNIQYDVSEQLVLFVEGQDAGITGEATNQDDAVPNVNADDFDLHQGYVLYKPYTFIHFKVGRQKLNLGKQRLSSSLEWVNTARVWDAFRFSIGRKGYRTLDAFVSKTVPVDPNGFNSHSTTGNRHFDSAFHGLYYSDWKMISRTQVDFYTFLRDDNNSEDAVWTLGFRFDTEINHFTFDGDFAWQVGDYGKEDHEAYAAHLGMTYSFIDGRKHTFGLAANYASGDSNSSDTKHETFDNLYPLNHAYYGYLDRFSWMNMSEINVTYNVDIHKSKLRLAYHWFWLDEPVTDSWYAAGNFAASPLFSHVNSAPGASRDAGSEFNLTVMTKHLRGNITSLFGYGHFFVGDYVDQLVGTSAEDADYIFGQFKLTF